MSERGIVMQVRKLVGADAELGNFIEGISHPDGTGDLASRLLLREFDGFHTRTAAGYSDPQDWGRRHLPANGGCAYIDLDHAEICVPESLSAFDFTACWHAMLRLTQQAQRRANAKLKPGLRLRVAANNTDFHGNSFGSHLNFLISRQLWNEMFHTKLQYLLLLASFQASSVIYAGQGKAGSEDGSPAAAYQLSQRADYLHTLIGPQTTFNRPVVNTRDESLCGESDGPGLARLHVIFYDSNLCHTANVLKVGVMQILLSMLEAAWLDASAILDDPLEAVKEWSRDPVLAAKARLLGEAEVSAVEHQWKFFEAASRFVEAGQCEEFVPRTAEIVRLWGEALTLLGRRDFVALAGKLDWVLKLSALLRAMEQRPELDFGVAEIRRLDLAYADLDPAEGLYWAYERNGVAERLVAESHVERFVHEPPEDTRAWTRAMLLRLAAQDMIVSVDWDRIRWRPANHAAWMPARDILLSNPLSMTRAEVEPVIQGAGDVRRVFEAVEAYASQKEPGGAGVRPAGLGGKDLIQGKE